MTVRSLTIAEVINRWTAYRRRMADLGLVEYSTHNNQVRIGHIMIAGLGTVALDQLRKSDVDLWVGERLQDHAPVTVRSELNVLRQILNWAVDEQLLGARPRLPTVQVPIEEQALPSEAAYVWALRSVPDNHQMALELLMLTGLSPHEAERVQVRDWRPSVDGKRPGLIGIGMREDFKVKSASRRRSVPLNDRAQALWERMTAGLRPLQTAFPKGAAMQKALARARAADRDAPPDARRITPKMMRQWFASQISDEQPEHVLQRLLGHSPGSKITRRHYVRSTDQQMTDAVQGVRA